jgi:uncharacterized protein involved in outer membrane biogenesis
LTLLDRLAALRRRNAVASTAASPAPRRRRWLRALAWTAGVFAVLVLAGFFVAPPVVKSLIETKASEKLGRKVSVGAIRINPLLLTAEVADFHLREADGVTDFVAFDLLRVDLELESLLRRAPVLREVRLENPRVNLVRIEGNRYNFSDMVQRLASAPAPGPATPAEPARFSVNNILVSGGQVDFDDRPDKTRHKVRDLGLAVPFISNLPYYGEIFVQPRFGATVNGTRIDLEGKTRPFGERHDTVLEIRLKNLNLPYYLEYIPVQLQAKPMSALLDADMDLTFSQPPGGPPKLLLGGVVTVREVAVNELDGRPLAEVPQMEAKLGQLDVFARRFVLEQIRLERPRLWIRRDAGGSLNLAKLAAVKASGATLAEARAEQNDRRDNPLEIAVGTVKLEGARITVEDSVPRDGFRATLDPVDVEAKGFDTAPGKSTEATLAFRTDAAETGVASVRYGFFEGSIEGEIRIGGVPIRRYAPYYRDAFNVDVMAGTLDVATTFAAAAGRDGAAPAASASGAALTLRDLRLRKRGASEDFLGLASLEAAEGHFDLGARAAGIGKLTLRKLAVSVKRARDGSLSIDGLVPARPAEASGANAPATAAQAGAGRPWQFSLDRFALVQGAARFDDEVPAQPVQTRVEPITLDVERLVIGKPGKAAMRLALVLNGTGRLAVEGNFVPQPFAAELKLDAAGIDVVPYQPYFAERINITLTSGQLAAQGRLGIAPPAVHGGAVPVTWQGSAAVNKLATLDKANAEDFLKWESLFFGGMKVRSDPPFMELADVALTDFYSRLVVNTDGTLNVQGIMASPAGEAAAPRDDAPPPKAATSGGAPRERSARVRDASKGKTDPKASPAAASTPGVSREAAEAVQRLVKIDKVTLQGGTIAFSDRFMNPNVSATLTEVGGRVTGLLSEPNSRADVDLRGKLANQAPLSITGKVNPLAGDLFADLKVSFRDIELPPFTPYSGKYAGYTIEKGKLTLELAYLIDKRKLSAQNRVFIDQFTFGEKVESPDATSLPVQLAVSLLKDRDGRINLDIPVEGSLDDPKFRLGKVIWQVITNLITKVVTAPFALLGSLGGGGGEELSSIDFAAGSAAFDDTAERKLDAIVKALRERPAVNFEVSGRADPVKDLDALRQATFDRKLKAQKRKELARRGQAPSSLDAVVIEPGADYERWLERAYKAEKFPKPRNFIGLEKDLPVPEMEKLMQANIVVGTNELRALGLQRAQAVKDFLAAAEGVGSGRVFLAEPKDAAGGAKDKAAASRVEFVLR